MPPAVGWRRERSGSTSSILMARSTGDRSIERLLPGSAPRSRSRSSSVAGPPVDDLEEAFDAGVDRVILGTIVLRDPELVSSAVARWGDRIAVVFDARDGRLATNGWLGQTDASAVEVAQRLAEKRVRHFVHTDIRRDGTLAGPNLAALGELIEKVDADVIASGGIASLDDIRPSRPRARPERSSVGRCTTGRLTSPKLSRLLGRLRRHAESVFHRCSRRSSQYRSLPQDHSLPGRDGGRVVKGVEFVDLRDAGDPVELAAFYDREGADELVFLDITASSDSRER